MNEQNNKNNYSLFSISYIKIFLIKFIFWCFKNFAVWFNSIIKKMNVENLFCYYKWLQLKLYLITYFSRSIKWLFYFCLKYFPLPLSLFLIATFMSMSIRSFEIKLNPKRTPLSFRFAFIAIAKQKKL